MTIGSWSWIKKIRFNFPCHEKEWGPKRHPMNYTFSCLPTPLPLKLTSLCSSSGYFHLQGTSILGPETTHKFDLYKIRKIVSVPTPSVSFFFSSIRTGDLPEENPVKFGSVKGGVGRDVGGKVWRPTNPKQIPGVRGSMFCPSEERSPKFSVRSKLGDRCLHEVVIPLTREESVCSPTDQRVGGLILTVISMLLISDFNKKSEPLKVLLLSKHLRHSLVFGGTRFVSRRSVR